MANMLLMCQKYVYAALMCQMYGKYVVDVSEVW